MFYTIFSMLAINATIRIPIDNAPTTSFYRYSYCLFPIYIFADQLERRKRQYLYTCSTGISFMAAVLFAKNFYFYLVIELEEFLDRRFWEMEVLQYMLEAGTTSE